MNDPIPVNRVEAPAEIVDPDQLIRVEEGLLVVPSGCILPPICIKTNRPVSEREMIHTELFWCTPWVLTTYLLLGPLGLLFFYLVAREQCTITYGLQARISNRTLLRKVVASLSAILFLVLTVFLAAASYTAWLFVPTGLLFVVALVLALFNRSPLEIAKCRNGMYWIKGFREDYLSQLPLEA